MSQDPIDPAAGGPADESRASVDLREEALRDALGRALLACQRAAAACDRALPALSLHEDDRALSVTECYELSEVCAQAIGRALGGRRGRFLAEELRLCARVSRACAGDLRGEVDLDACSAACAANAVACDRAAGRLELAGDRRAA